MSRYIVFRFCFALVCLAPLLAQSNVASLTGIVTDTSGAAIDKVEITAANKNTGIVTRTATNASGVYSFPSLLAGPYQVEVQAAGFKKNSVQSLVLETAQKARLDLTLEVGDVRQVVEVTAATTPLQQESAEISETITSKDILASR